MELEKLTMSRYDHGQPVGLSDAQWAWLVLVVTIAAGVLFVFPPLSFILVGAAFLVFKRPRRLYVGPRYLICGKKILYYANVQKVSMEDAGRRLVLKSSTGRLLVLERDRFQTKARKPDRIQLNKAARFEKVARKIVEHVRRAAPHAELSGVGDLTGTGP